MPTNETIGLEVTFCDVNGYQKELRMFPMKIKFATSDYGQTGLFLFTIHSEMGDLQIRHQYPDNRFGYLL